MGGDKNEASVPGVKDEALNEVGRRLAAAWASYLVGHKGVDRMLKQAPERIGGFWKELAELIYVAQGMRTTETKELDELRLREVITKLVQ